MTDTHDDFHRMLTEDIGEIQPFSPMACYNPDGDCVEFHLSNENYYARRVDGWVTLFYSEETNEIVGGMIKGVKTSLLPRFPGVKVDFEGHSVGVSFLLRAPAYQTGDEVVQKTYREAIARTSELPPVDNLMLTC